MIDNPNIVRIKDTAGIARYGNSFISVYKKAFAGAPYFESFKDEEVMEVMRELAFAEGGICLVMLLGDKVIGISGGYGLHNEPEISALFKGQFPSMKPEDVFYFAELAVSEEYRRKGYGSQLIDARIKHMDENFEAGLQRTQAIGSNSLNLYLKRGFEQVAGMIQKVETYVRGDEGRKKVQQERTFTIKFA